jgi:hypothetical protein
MDDFPASLSDDGNGIDKIIEEELFNLVSRNWPIVPPIPTAIPNSPQGRLPSWWRNWNQRSSKAWVVAFSLDRSPFRGLPETFAHQSSLCGFLYHAGSHPFQSTAVPDLRSNPQRYRRHLSLYPLLVAIPRFTLYDLFSVLLARRSRF